MSAGFGGVEPGPELPDVSRDRQRIEAGLTRVAGAFTDMGPEASGLGGGSHLPAERRPSRGHRRHPLGAQARPGAAIAQTLAADARAAGIETIFLSAADATVARVYERAGFVRVGTAGMATGPAA